MPLRAWRHNYFKPAVQYFGVTGMRKCWELKEHCLARIEGPDKWPCPAFVQNKSCWEIDWWPFLQTLSEEQSLMIMKMMLEKCPRCPVFATIQQGAIDHMLLSMLLHVASLALKTRKHSDSAVAAFLAGESSRRH
jgi:hypothetical protein